MADGTLAPRLMTTAEAKAYLRGKHPAQFGCKPIGRMWDRLEIDHKLDVRAGIESPSASRGGTKADHDSAEEAELAALEARLAAARGV